MIPPAPRPQRPEVWGRGVRVSFSLELPSDDQYVGVVRHLVEKTLGELGVAQGSIDDIALAVTEACANVVRHGAQAAGFDVELCVEGTRCQISIREQGGTFDADDLEHTMGEADDPLTHGRGIPLIRLLVDDLSYVPDAHGTTVVLTKTLDVPPGSLLHP